MWLRKIYQLLGDLKAEQDATRRASIADELRAMNVREQAIQSALSVHEQEIA